MPIPDIIRGSFTIRRDYAAPPARAFAAWTRPELRARWFAGPSGCVELRREMDFRVGGLEILHGRFPDGVESIFTCRFHEIVPDERIVYVYDMHVAGAHMSVSLASVEFKPGAGGKGTHLVFSEDAIYVDGADGNASREHGTGWLIDKYGAVLEGADLALVPDLVRNPA